ncbi:MAG TPA: PIN domain-containing protein [Sphingomicrobium sp.]|nr:PIN domain-containing protein [Sphingomicrobium sp.]
MRSLIDTNIAILLIEGDRSTFERVDALPEAPMLSVISTVELEAGLYEYGQEDADLRSRLNLLLDRVDVLPFTSREVAAYGRIVATLGYSRRMIIDRMIAATALTQGAALLTANPRDFRNIADLTVEDWS